MTTQDTISTDSQDVPIAQALRYLRISMGLKQTEVARRGGPDFRTLSHWETGRKQPSLKLLIRYLNAIGLDLHDLQNQFDELAGLPNPPATSLISLERRLGALERWRLELTAASLEKRNIGCEPLEKSSTGS